MNSGYAASLAFYPFRSLIINPGPAGFPVHRRHSFCMSGFRSFAAPATKQLPLSAFHSSAIMGIQANQIRPTLSHTAQHQLASLKNESVKVGGEKWAGTVKKQLSEPRHGGPSLQGVSAMRWEGLREHRPGKRTWERKRCGGGGTSHHWYFGVQPHTLHSAVWEPAVSLGWTSRPAEKSTSPPPPTPEDVLSLRGPTFL